MSIWGLIAVVGGLTWAISTMWYRHRVLSRIGSMERADASRAIRTWARISGFTLSAVLAALLLSAVLVGAAHAGWSGDAVTAVIIVVLVVLAGGAWTAFVFERLTSRAISRDTR